VTTTTGTTTWTADLSGITHDFEVARVELSLDELNTVYVHAEVTVAPFPDSVDADLRAAIIDGTQRITLTAVRDILTPTPDTQTRTFDLVLHERSINESGEVVFQCASDEALLELRGSVADYQVDYHTTATDDTARDVIDRVLDDYLGVALETGTVDATMTRTLGLTNLIVNPSFEVDTSSWSARSNASGVTRSTAQSSTGSASLRWTAASGGNASIQHEPVTIAAPASPADGAYYFARAFIRSTVARVAHLTVMHLDVDGNIVASTVGASSATLTSGWNVFEVLAFVSDPRVVALQLVPVSEGNSAGNQHYIDEVALYLLPRESYTDDATPSPHNTFYTYALIQTCFDGSKTDAYYNYNWLGTADLSPSVRVPKDDRGFQLTLMQPGQTVRAFLDPIVDVTGGRLFCDEARDWRLVDDAYTVAGTLALEDATNVTTWKDTVSISESFDGLPTTFTGVVIVYETVTRPNGAVSRKYDVAGDDSGRVYRKVVEGAFPGPGAAAALLARAAGRQRSIPVTATPDLDATPGMALTATIAGTDYTGTVSKVVWEWSDNRDQMTITPRDLIEV
jgi:hypothetical protein